MASLEFDEEAKRRMTEKLKDYLEQEHDLSIGSFDAEFMLDFIAKEFGATFYNKGLSDAQEVMMARIEIINDAIYELEKPDA